MALEIQGLAADSEDFLSLSKFGANKAGHAGSTRSVSLRWTPSSALPRRMASCSTVSPDRSMRCSCFIVSVRSLFSRWPNRCVPSQINILSLPANARWTCFLRICPSQRNRPFSNADAKRRVIVSCDTLQKAPISSTLRPLAASSITFPSSTFLRGLLIEFPPTLRAARTAANVALPASY